MFDSDKVLLKGCKKGKKRAQEALYAKYSKSMYAVALRYAKVTQEAEDILQSFLQISPKVSKIHHQLAAIYRHKGNLEQARAHYLLAGSDSSAEDVLEKIPSVAISEEGNITLRGNENVTILINGRKSQMRIDALNANMIEKIEVSSSNIKYVSYDEVNQQLKVGFEAPETELRCKTKCKEK